MSDALVRHWRVEATSVSGAKMFFGLPAPDLKTAHNLAAGYLPWKTGIILVTEIGPRCEPHGVRRCGKCLL